MAYDGWIAITRLSPGRKEGEAQETTGLQPFFDRWKSLPTAGCPEWLWKLGTPLPKKPRGGFGHEFIPDVVWDDPGMLVAELKYGKKTEALALGEVLHHAHLIARIEKKECRALVVTQPGTWITGAVARLPRGVVEHLECDLLRYQGETLLWLSDPHAKLEACELPTAVSSTLEAAAGWNEGRWWRRNDEPTWVWAANPLEHHPFLTGKVVIVSEVRTPSLESATWVGWTGSFPHLGERWSTADWNGAGRFFILTANGGGTLPFP